MWLSVTGGSRLNSASAAHRLLAAAGRFWHTRSPMAHPKHVIEYAAIRGAAAFLNALPYRLALALAWLHAAFAFHVLRFRRNEAERRIRLVLGDAMPAGGPSRVAWVSLRNLCFNIVEMMRSRCIDSNWVERHVAGGLDSIRRVREQLGPGSGVVIALPHMGNWDIAGIAAHRLGLPVFTVAGKQKNPLVNAWMNRQRSHGIDVMQRGSSTLRTVVTRLRHGDAFAILPDSRTRRPDLLIPFLGGTANLGRGMAQFARAAGVPIWPVVATRTGWRQHRIEVLNPVFPDKTLDKETDIRRMTAAVIAGFDAAIRRQPEQWFWYNKRWVLDPLEPAADVAAADPALQEKVES